MRGIAILAERENEVASIHAKGAIMATAPMAMMINMIDCCRRWKLRCELNKFRQVVVGLAVEMFSEEAIVTLLIDRKTHAAKMNEN